MEERAFTQARAFAQTRKFYRTSYMLRLGFFTVAAFLLFTFNQLKPAFTFEIRQYFNDVLVHSYRMLHKPVDALEKKISRYHTAFLNFNRTAILEQQLEEMQGWQITARQALQENQKLRESLKYIKRDLQFAATARAFFSFDGRYLQSMTLDAGAREGIKIHQAVVAYGRLIGRIVEVSRHSSRVLLITDMHSRVPVETEWSRLRGILTGTNSKKLAFLHEREKKDLLNGELVFSTGEGGIFPAGHLIGKLVITDQDEVFVDPGIEWRKIDIVQIAESPESLLNENDVQETRR